MGEWGIAEIRIPTPEGPSPDGPGMFRHIELNRDVWCGSKRPSRFRPVGRRDLRFHRIPSIPIINTRYRPDRACVLTGRDGDRRFIGKHPSRSNLIHRYIPGPSGDGPSGSTRNVRVRPPTSPTPSAATSVSFCDARISRRVSSCRRAFYLGARLTKPLEIRRGSENATRYVASR